MLRPRILVKELWSVGDTFGKHVFSRLFAISMTFFPVLVLNSRNPLLGLSRHLQMSSGGSFDLSSYSSLISHVYRAFGPKIVPPQPILKALPKIFGHSDKAVRSDVCGPSISIICLVNGRRNRALCLRRHSTYG